ncbi:MAG: tetratricopeptide repeat protein [Capsulimonas sp.]|uniref:ATP-binding protein n=1 Tax=Capsulimonas sp. TaxID=2494211 RepID=UPI0032650E28
MATAQPHIWRIELFGGLRARAGTQTVDRFQTQKTAALLAYLAFYPQRRHLREELVDLLWPDAESEAGRHRLSQALVSLRAQLEPEGVAKNSILRADRQTVGLDPSVVTDVAEFEAALLFAKNQAGAEAVERLERAVTLYQGDLLPGYYEDWIITERQRLLDMVTGACRRLVQHYEQSHQFERALDYARRGLEIDPISEDLHVDLIRILAASGQRAAAQRHFREMERILIKELDEPPSPATKAVVEQILQNSAPPPSVRSGGRVRETSLPSPLTRFFGRDAEITQAQSLLTSGKVRLLTLTGIGGGGKTRLAVEIAGRVAADFSSAVWFAPLADLSDARSIPGAIAETLRLTPSADAPVLDQVIASLSAQPSLLVLDNLEHLVEAAAPIVREMLSRAPSLTILVTSRQRLGLEGEREISVPPLASPIGSFKTTSMPVSPERLMEIDSIQLFVDRAQAVRPAFRVTAQNAAAIAQLCERLEGIPLVIELCAAWAQTLTPAQMLTQLTRRFELLVSRSVDIAPRHQSLRAALDYSYVQLPPDLQRFFGRLSVFRGGWTLAAAAAVGGDSFADTSAHVILEAITTLRERSLILADETEEGGAFRYRMLETLREFSAEQVPEDAREDLHRAHAEYLMTLAEAAEPEIAGGDQAPWLMRMEAEHDNFRAAMHWALDTQSAEIGLRLAGALAYFWEARGYLGEGQEWLEKLLALPQGQTDALRRVRANALTGRGYLMRNQGASAGIDAVMEEALRLWREIGDDHGLAVTLQVLATLAYSREDCDLARVYLEEGLGLSRKLDDPMLVAQALMNLGNIALEQAEFPEAWKFYSDSLEIFRASKNRFRIAHVLNNMGLVSQYQKDYTKAYTLLQESLAICRELSGRAASATTLLNLGTLHRIEGRFAAAREMFSESVMVAQEVGERRLLVYIVKELGHMACAEQDYAAGVRLLAISQTLGRALALSFKPSDPTEIERDLDLARTALGDEAYEAAWNAGARLTLTQAFDEAIKFTTPY